MLSSPSSSSTALDTAAQSSLDVKQVWGALYAKLTYYEHVQSIGVDAAVEPGRISSLLIPTRPSNSMPDNDLFLI